ncbi:hypothetical protein V1512DRAFT_209721 [Lipomyces arxii]|uniref:uncharacterized protein n=1 Tax=Lipomyces arxii TaxID=56418 RepID=UPI0034CF76BA
MAVRPSIQPLPNSDFVTGYPGIADTDPAIAGIVELRSRTAGLPFKVRSVSLKLLRNDEIFRRMGRSTKFETSYAAVVLFTEQKYGSEYLALDLPFLYSLNYDGADLPSSINDPDYVKMEYTLELTVESDSYPALKLSRPVSIMNYSSKRLNLNRIEVAFSNYCGSREIRGRLSSDWFGPGDVVKLHTHVTEHSYTRKTIEIKLMLVRELYIGDSKEPTKTDTILGTEFWQKANDGLEFAFTMPFSPSSSYPDGPNVGINAFSIESREFSIRYAIILRYKFDTELLNLRVPVKVSPFPDQVCEPLWKAICDAAASRHSTILPEDTIIRAQDDVSALKTLNFVLRNGNSRIVIE